MCGCEAFRGCAQPDNHPSSPARPSQPLPRYRQLAAAARFALLQPLQRVRRRDGPFGCAGAQKDGQHGTAHQHPAPTSRASGVATARRCPRTQPRHTPRPQRTRRQLAEEPACRGARASSGCAGIFRRHRIASHRAAAPATACQSSEPCPSPTSAFRRHRIRRVANRIASHVGPPPAPTSLLSETHIVYPVVSLAARPRQPRSRRPVGVPGGLGRCGLRDGLRLGALAR